MNESLLKKFYKSYSLKKINIKNKTWEYISCGEGKETLLLLPGGGQTAQGNFRLIQAFENKYKVIIPTIYAVDSIDEFCFAINSILEKEQTKKIIIYGLSIGGLMAQSYLKRNKEKVSLLILSHCCTPKSRLYRRKIIPLLRLSFLLPIIPQSFFVFLLRHFAGKAQNAPTVPENISPDTNNIKVFTMLFNEEFIKKYFTKRLLTTWANLHKDFVNETFSVQDFSDWKGRVLVLRSDNDPLMQDEGEFKKIYPNVTEYVFHNTGHVAYYYAFPEMVKVMKQFLLHR